MQQRTRIILWSAGAVAAVPVVIGMVQGVHDSLHSKPAAAASSTVAAASALASSAPPSSPAPATSTPAAPPSSAPPKPKPSTKPPAPAPTVLVSDLPVFDQDGDPSCRMHYSQTADGRVVTRFTLTRDGELITHVAASNMPTGFVRNDQQVTANYWAYTYDTTLAQITDMGAVLHLGDGSQVACGISAGAMVP